MASRQPAPGAKRSWREAPSRPTAAPTRASKAPLRWLLTFVVLALLAGFAWLVWQPARPTPPTHFVALLTGESDLLSTPPILFEQATMEPLTRFDEASEDFDYTDASEAQRTGDVDAIAARLADLTIGADDRLIVYVSAHGVSDGDEAYVLARDYDLREPDEGRYAATDLIEAVAAVPASTKLLVFDCSRLAVNSRMGMAANEFASLIEQAAKEVDDPRLAIVLAGPALETSPFGLAEGRAALGGALVDAVVGDADLAANGGNDDRSVSLAELRAYVVKRCSEARAASPVPKFVVCGPEASLEALEDRPLVRLPAAGFKKEIADLVAAATAAKKSAKPPAVKPAQAIAAAAAAPADGNDNAATQAGPGRNATPQQPESSSDEAPANADDTATGGAEPADGSNSAATPPGGAAPDGDGEAAPPVEGAQPPAEPATPPAVAEADDDAPPILLAWRLRDRLNGSGSLVSDATWPVDYAPQLWNELNAKLVALHLVQLGQGAEGAGSASEITDQIQPYVRGLRQLAEDAASARNGVLTDQLNAARLGYQASEAWQNMQRLDERYRGAVLDLRRHIVLANQLVQWHAARLGSSANAGASAETIREIEQFLEATASLDSAIADFEATQWRSRDDAEPVLRRLANSRRTARELADRLANRLERSIDAIAGGADPAAQRDLEALLATDVATAEQRESLLTAVGKERAASGNVRLAPPSWNDVVEHLRLEIQLVQLVDPSYKESAAFDAVLALPRMSGDADAGQLRDIRTAGRTLQKFYADIPAHIGELEQPGSRPDDARTAERIVAVIHPRDASTTLAAEVGFVTPRQEPPVEIFLAAPPPTNLREGAWTPLTFKLALPNVSDARVTATISDFDARAIDVSFSKNLETSRRGAAQTFTGSGELPISVFVRPKGPLNAPVENRTEAIALHVRVEAGSESLEQERQASVVIPRPNRVELVAYTITPQLVQNEQPRSNLIELQPYPNRATTFALGIVNFTDEEKNLHVELFAVPPLAGPNETLIDAGWPPGRLLDGEGQPPEALANWAAAGLSNAPLVASCDIELPADERAHRLELAPPKIEPPPAAPAAEGAAAPPAEPPPPLASVDVTHGLVVRLTNKDRPDDIKLKWVEVTPLRPSSYFEFDPPRFDNRGLRFAARPTDPNGDGRRDLPPGIAEKPAKFVIRGDGTVFPAGVVVPDEFMATDSQAQLEIQPRDRLVGVHTVAIDVDDVPRAVQWDVNFELQTVTPNESPRSIRIMRVGMQPAEPTPPRLYRTTPYVDFPAIDPKQWPKVVDVGADRAASFDVSRGDRPPVMVRLQVDAPWDAFTRVGDGSFVRVSWGDNAAASYNLYYDRFLKSEIVKFNEDGEMVVTSTVDDFEFPLPAPGVNNKVVRLTAQLVAKGLERVDWLNIVLDQSPPKIDSVVLRETVVYLGTPTVDVQPRVTDLSGIESVEVWFTPKQPRTADELKPDAAQRFDNVEQRPFQPEFEETRTLFLKAKAPAELGDYFVTVRVTDRSGQSSVTLGEEHLIRVQKKPEIKPGPIVADLKGKVVLANGAPGKSLKVWIEKIPTKNATTDGEGKFVIPQVKQGPHKLLVEGRVGSGNAKGELEVDLQERPQWEWQMEIPATVDWQTSPPED